MRIRQTFLLMMSAVLGLVASASADLSVVNGNFENTTGMTLSGGWYGLAWPVGWSSSGNLGLYVVAPSATGNPTKVFNLDALNVSQNVGSNAFNARVTLTFDIGPFGAAGTVVYTTARITDANSNVLASITCTNGTGQTLTTYVPSNTTVRVEFLKNTGASPWLDNVAVSSVAVTAPPELAVVNGDFSDTTGMAVRGGGWYDGVPRGWSGSWGNYGLLVPPGVANVQGAPLSQSLGYLGYPAAAVTVDFLYYNKLGDGQLSASLLTNSVVAVSQFYAAAYGTKSIVVSNLPPQTRVSVVFWRSAVAGGCGIDNVSVATTFSPTAAPVITNPPTALSAMLSGTVRTLSVGAIGVVPLSYQWRRGGVAVTDGTNATLVASQAGNYDVVVSGGNSLSVTSSVAKVVAGVINGDFVDATGMTLSGGWYNGVPYGWDTPSSLYSVNVSDGATPPTANLDGKTFVQTLGTLTNASDVFVTFDVEWPWNTGDQLTAYLLNGSSVVASNSYTAAVLGELTAATLSATNLPAGAALAVKFVGSGWGSVALDNVKAYVLAPNGAPVITRLPAKTAMPAGTRTSLSVLAVGVPPLAYQWLDGGGAALTGATGVKLTVSDAGDYRVAVTAANGLCVTSGVAQVSGSLVNGDFSDLSGLGNTGGGWYGGVPIGWQSTRYPTGGLYNVSAGGGPSSAVCNPETMPELQQPVGTLLRKSDVELTFDAPNTFNRATPWIGATLLDTSNPAYPQVLATTNVPFGTGYQLRAPNVPGGTALTIQFISAVANNPCGLDNVKVRMIQPGLLVMVH